MVLKPPAFSGVGVTLEKSDIEKEDLYSGSRKKAISEARSLFCYWCVRELGESMTGMAILLGLTQPAVGYAVERGKRLAKKGKYDLLD